jgi:hypothetical protein
MVLSKHLTPLRALTLAIAICAPLALAGCGLETSTTTGSVIVTVTRAFGTQQVRTFTRHLARPQSVAAVIGGAAHGAVFINGVNRAQLSSGKVYPGDHVWLDLQPTAEQVRVAVGSYPEPFTHGVGGKRLPVTLECAADVATACSRIAAALASAGIHTASQLLGTGSGQDSIAVVVGTGDDLTSAIAARLIAYGPSLSGVFARLNRGRLELLDQRGQVTRTLDTGSGLIAATADRQSAPVWLITGTDVAGVNAAAGALSPARLRDRFAMAIDGSTDVPLPEVRSR